MRRGGEMIEDHRDQRRDGAAMAIGEIDERLRQVIVRDDDRRTVQQERRDEIREAVRMGERNRAEVDVVRRDAHRGADVRAVGDEVLFRADDAFRQAGGTGGELDQSRTGRNTRALGQGARRDAVAIDQSFDGEVAENRGDLDLLRVAIDRHHDQAAHQRGDERRDEIGRVRDLNRERVPPGHSGGGELRGELVRAGEELLARGHRAGLSVDQGGGLGGFVNE
jgi:hypothetical protein